MTDIKKTLGEIAFLVGGVIFGDEGVEIRSVAPIERATPGDITFVSDKKHMQQLSGTKASAVIVSSKTEPISGINLLLCSNPYLAFAKILNEFKPIEKYQEGIHPKAEVHNDSLIGKGTCIYPCAVIDSGARIGDGARIYPGVYIGCGVEIGDESILYSNVSVREGCKIGKRVIIHPNAVMGSDGFGYTKDGEAHFKIPQIGIVVIEDDVEIGAGVTIDRATLGETIIRKGTKIDNLTQIAHNVEIGENSIIISQVGISGSSKIGKRVTVAGQVGIAGHLEIGDDVRIGAKSGLMHNIPAGATFSGIPAKPHAKWLRTQAAISKLPDVIARLNKLGKKVDDLAMKLEKAGTDQK